MGASAVGVVCASAVALAAEEAPAEPSADRQQAAAAPAADFEEEVGQSKKQAARFPEAERQILEQQRGVLLPGGQLVLEPSFQYTAATRNIVQVSGFSLIPAIIIGRLEVAEIERDIILGGLRARYGLSDRVELSASIPFIYRRDELTFTADANEPNQRDLIDDSGIGDVEVGIFTHVLRQSGWIPDTILNIRGKAPTGKDPFEIDPEDEVALGTGTWGVSGGFTVVRAFDPAVVFGGVDYFWNIKRDSAGDFGSFDPGDTWQWNLGLAFALNERLAFSLSVQQDITGRAKLNGDKLAGSDANSAAVFFGASYSLSPMTSIYLNIGVGATEDSPDLNIEFRIPLSLPYRFPSF